MKAVSSASGVISVSQQLAGLIILVLLERSLSPAKVLRRQICPSPFKLMMDPHELLRVVQGRMSYRKHPLYKNLPFSSVAK